MFFSTLHAPLFVLSAYAVGVLAVSAVSDATRDPSVVNDSTQSGAGGYTIEPSNLSIHVDTGDIPKDIYRNVEDIANIKLSRGLAASNSGKEFGFRGCNEDQMYDILDAIDASRKYIATVEAHLAQRGGGPYYKTWFGQNGLDRLTRVRENIANLKKYTLVGYTADCHTCRAPRPNLWLDPHRRIITLCTDFWTYEPDGVDLSQATFLIAALAVLPQYGGLKINAEGWEKSVGLALSNPDGAVRNLDSYLEFLVVVNGLEIIQDLS